jgi:hypothetical protein
MLFETNEGHPLFLLATPPPRLGGTVPSPTPINGAWGVARGNTAVGVSPKTFLLLLQ